MDLRSHVGKKLKHHRVLEGGCYYGGVYYLLFGNMSEETTIVCKIKAGKEKEVLKVSKVLHVGHANDCCVRDGILYIAHSGKSQKVHRVDTATLEKKKDITVTGCKGGFNAITCFGKGFLIKRMESRKCFVVDSDFHYQRTITLSKTLKVGQGMHWDPKTARLYRGSSVGQSHKNYVAVYNSKGKYLKKIHYDHKCELEDVMVVGDRLVIGIYKKYKKKGKKHFEAYLKTLARL